MCVCQGGVCAVLLERVCCAEDVLSGHAVREVLSLAGDAVLSRGMGAVQGAAVCNRKRHHNTPASCGQTDRQL